MSGLAIPGSADLSRQLRQYVDSLQSAGIEWIPRAPEPAAVNVLQPACSYSAQSLETAESVTPAGSLFEGGDQHLGSPEQRRQELSVLAECVSKCTHCAELAATRTQTVFGVGRLDPEICFVGEAPGADEDAQGEPFVGAAGQLLNRIITACGMKREEVYICNILKCRPPGNRLPLPHEAANCRQYLERQLELVRPRFICALGACAAQNLLDTKLSIGKLRGQFQQYRGIPVLCTYHPAYLLRSPDKKREVWEDMKKLLQRMGRTVAAGK